MESEEYEAISHTVICDDLTSVVKGIELSFNIKQAIQKGSIQSQQNKPGTDKIQAHCEMVDVLGKLSPKMMKQAQGDDVDISKVMHYAKSGKKTIPAQIL